MAAGHLRPEPPPPTWSPSKIPDTAPSSPEDTRVARGTSKWDTLPPLGSLRITYAAGMGLGRPLAQWCCQCLAMSAQSAWRS